MRTDAPSIPGCQRGLSLVELMIAMTLGLLVIGAVSGVFLTTSRNYTQDELLSRLQENARYAMHVLSKDLSMGGYWGPLMTGENINTDPRDCTSDTADLNNNGTPDTDEAICQSLFVDSVLSLDSDCPPAGVTGANWAIDIEDPIEVMSGVTSTEAHNAYSCIEESEFVGGSDILVIKRVEGEELDSTRNDTDTDVQTDLFMRTDGNETMLFEYVDTLDVSEGSDIKDWRYRTDIYYIRNYFLDADDGIPTLVRRTLDGDGFATEAEAVAQGIEYFRVMYGIDDDGDATANVYKSGPTLGELEDVTSARIYLLARSMSEDPGYENDKIYELGDWSVDYSGTSSDGFYRRVFSTTVTLRNQRNRILTTGGT